MATLRGAPQDSNPTRRHLMKMLAAVGVGSPVFRRALAAAAEQSPRITPEMVAQAEWVCGLRLSAADRKTLADALTRSQRHLDSLRAVPLSNDVPPALVFNPAPGLSPVPPARTAAKSSIDHAPAKPRSGEDLAFLNVAELAALVRSRQVSSVELTRLYLDRLKKYDPFLFCVVSRTEELALRLAEQADREIAAGHYRGALHGIPWGAKDLIAYPGYKTTWGALPFKDQVLDTKATVARRLEEAGAVLVAKLSLGAIAMGDRWFGGKTRNPWDNRRGSSGSSAGSCAATAAGLVGFALGSETLGSIVSPCRECGTTGLRPTFGRVSRHGCMSLCWSMDKIGPIARSVEDCALVFGAIHGADGLDAAAVDRPFRWPSGRELRQFRVGYFDDGRDAAKRDDLRVLRDLGVQLIPIKLPEKYPLAPLIVILECEAAAAFDDLTRQGVTEGLNEWPQSWHQGEFVTAVDYLRANRVRTMLLRAMEEVMRKVDLYVGGKDLLLTNLTGHPTVVLPDGFRKAGGGERPVSITFTGRLYGEAELLAVAAAYQRATGHHRRRPPLERLKSG